MIDRELRRCSFGSAADVYERVRPGYPAEAIAWAMGARPLRVLDLGAGTGKLTKALLTAGHDVVAVEPDEGMRAEFAAALPGVALLAGAAEAIPLPDGSVDAATAGQAWHWFDLDRAVPEIARVLVRGGTLAVVWNFTDQSVQWVAELAALVPDGFGQAGPDDEADESFGERFGPVERAHFAHVQALDVDGLVALVASWSYTITRPAAERRRLLRDVETLGHRVADSAGRIELPYGTVCLRAAPV